MLATLEQTRAFFITLFAVGLFFVFLANARERHILYSFLFAFPAVSLFGNVLAAIFLGCPALASEFIPTPRTSRPLLFQLPPPLAIA